MALIANQSRRLVTLMALNAIYLTHMRIVIVDISAISLGSQFLVCATMTFEAVIHLDLTVWCTFTVTSFTWNLLCGMSIG